MPGENDTGMIPNREIMKVGKWNASGQVIDVTSEYLDQLVANYENLNSKVTGFGIPIKLGHNTRVGEPAYGWATNVRRQGDTLLADFADVPSEIVDAVKAKRYNALSVEIWPKVKYAGQEFTQVLSGVALLGSEWPAVKGLKPLSAFAEFETETPLSFQEAGDEPVPNTFTQEQVDQLVAAHETKLNATFDAKFAAEKARADAAVAALAAAHAASDKAAVDAIIEAAEKEGKIVPASKPAIQKFADTVLKAATGEGRAAAIKEFSDFVKALPTKVEFKEKGAGASEREEDGTISASDKVDAAVKAERAKDPKMSYADAVAKVFAADPKLKQEYAEAR